MLEIEFNLEKILTFKNIAIMFAICFIVGFIIGKIAMYKQWIADIESTIIYIEDYDFEKTFNKNVSITYIQTLVANARKEFEFKKYKSAVKTIINIQNEYKTLEIDKDFQRLMKKIQ